MLSVTNKLFFVFLLSLFLNGNISCCQNFVPNASFENKLNCPYLTGQIDYAIGWMSFRESPDYFNSCANITQPILGTPTNARGNQVPLNGDAYIGFVAFGKTTSNVREHTGIQLLQPLSIGIKYYVKFYVSTADTVSMECGSNKLGARFSTLPYSFSNPSPIDNFSHILSDSITYDKANWIKISGSFIADSAYQYILLGNFFDDNNTDTIHCTIPTSSYAYYYLDGVVVSSDSIFTDTLFATTHELLPHKSISIYPNPAVNFLIVSANNLFHELNLYNESGKLIFNQNKITNSSNINLQNFSDGIYLVRIKIKNKYLYEKFIINK